MEDLEKTIETLSRKENINRSIHDKRVRKEYLLLEQYKDDPRILEILKNFPRPTNLEVGTVGAYLWGGGQKYFGNIHATCSAIYSNSISYSSFNESGEGNDSKCIHQIWVYDKYLHKVAKHQDAFSSKAYVYIPDILSEERTEIYTNKEEKDEKGEKRYGLKKRDLDILKKDGITHVSLLVTKNGKHKIVVPMTEISFSYFSQDDSDEYSSNSNDSCNSCNSSNYLYLILVFIFIVLISLLYVYNK